MDQLVISLLAINFLSATQVSGADFRLTPSTFIIGGQNPTTSLNMTCTPNLPGISSVFIIEIGKKSQPGTNNEIIHIPNTGHDVVITDSSYTSRMSTSGSINGSRGSLMMSLRDLRCEDAASYYCTANVMTDFIQTDETYANVTAQTNPGTIEMIPTPRKDLLYDIGETVTFNCFGQIGNREGSMESLWNWQWRDTFGFNSQWVTYPNTHNNITFDVKIPAGNCQYTARSVLTHVVKSTDNGRELRCFFYNEAYQDNFTIYTGIDSSTSSSSSSASS